MGSKAKHDYMPALRRSFWEALQLECRKRGKLPFEILHEDIYKQDPVKFLELMLKTAPREANVTGQFNHSHRHDHAHTHEGLPSTDALLNEVILEAEEASHEELVSDGPVLPAPVRSQ